MNGRVVMTLIDKFAPVIAGIPAPFVRDPRLLIDEDKAAKIAIYYAPFEHVNRSARIVLVGITPGPTQMEKANDEARRLLKAGASPDAVLEPAKALASFGGEVFRSNLIRQLNHWGVPRWLGIDDAAALFSSAAAMLHPTSLIRYPAFVNDLPYAGAPDMLKHPLLNRHLHEHFVREFPQLPEALFFSLGPKVQRVLAALTCEGLIAKDRIIGGLLHGSPNNTYRIDYLTGPRDGPPPYRTNPTDYDAGRAAFRARFLRPEFPQRIV